MPVDNHEKVAALLPDGKMGDWFWYTELLDRRKGQRVRVLRAFHHATQQELLEQWPTIRSLCEANQVRALTHLSPRSYAKVGKLFVRMTVEAALQGHWSRMHRLWPSACGRVVPEVKLWLFDVDHPDSVEAASLEERLVKLDALVTKIPSRKGYHLISKPHRVDYDHVGIELHRDCGTNLYIPDAAA